MIGHWAQEAEVQGEGSRGEEFSPAPCFPQSPLPNQLTGTSRGSSKTLATAAINLLGVNWLR
ncbi:hypothetical protein CK516_33090 [Nostoc sp. 'Peltigera malacea cyanobiont' DB3992]|nr:hypothetical protein CK516_33090 [Nostoc sp. 'Peltigera malacea cyanobiont' DB3992]